MPLKFKIVLFSQIGHALAASRFGSNSEIRILTAFPMSPVYGIG
jgi:hypothetical protein